MKKTNEPGKELIKDLHDLENKPLKDKIHEVWVFTQKLVAATFAVGVGVAGVLAEVHATRIQSGLYRDAVIVSGSCAIVAGFVLLYLALMKVGK